MVIECEQCQTAFEIDPSRLKREGSKVRCAICRHVFLAFPPAETPGDVEETAEEILPEASEPEEWDPFRDLKKEGIEGTRKDQELEAELDSVYRDAFQEPEEPPFSEPVPPDMDVGKVLREAAKKEAEAASHPVIDFPPLKEEDPEELVFEPKEPPTSEKTPEASESKKKTSRTRSRSLLLLLILLLLVLCAGAVFLFKPDLIQNTVSLFSSTGEKTGISTLWDRVSGVIRPAEKPVVEDAGVAHLSFEAVAGAFALSEKDGRLFVISGRVVNRYPDPRSHILIRGSILDDKGKVIMARETYAGNTFTDQEIKTLPMEEIRTASQNRDGMAKQNVRVPAGAAIPFMIVFENLPENLTEFTVEPVRSVPGT